jgi:hypothetical protein
MICLYFKLEVSSFRHNGLKWKIKWFEQAANSIQFRYNFRVTTRFIRKENYKKNFVEGIKSHDKENICSLATKLRWFWL